MLRLFFICLILLICPPLVSAQYTLNGNATQNDCHCYTLTNDALSQSGSVWNNNKINLTQSFDFKFDIFLGCADLTGADGIAFVLQPISTSVGTLGGGLGYSGVTPAAGVTIDTWQNGSPASAGPDGDPAYDHIAIQLNGDLNHKDSVGPGPINNIAGPVTAIDGNDNIEDCQWHILRIVWDANTKTFSAYMDGRLRVSAVKDFVTDVFHGDPMVFWGFTGSTGGSKNRQQVCTALRPIFRFLPGQKRCIGETINFYDSTISSAPLIKSYWDFGDGRPIDSIHLNPVHTYSEAGNYTVKQTVVGADGCIEINSQLVIIGSTPLVAFDFNNACVLDAPVNFTNTSMAAFGTVNHWYWDLGDSTTSGLETISKIYTTPGVKKVRLAVRSLEGCMSDTVEHLVQVYQRPSADFYFLSDQCAVVPVQFNGIFAVSDGTISEWKWNFDSSASVGSAQNPTHDFSGAGLKTISLSTTTSNGCTSNIASKTINILPAPIAGFNNNPVCLLAPAQFRDSSYSNSGAAITGWWWDLGNGTTDVNKSPTTTYTNAGDVNIRLVVKTDLGCLSDTLNKLIHIESKPIAKFAYGLPVCEDQPFQLSDSSTIGVGSIKSWSWRLNGSIINLQHPVTALPAGNHIVRLVVVNGNGCDSDSSSVGVMVSSKPAVDFVSTDACINSSVSFKAMDLSGNISRWQWKFDNGNVAVAKDTQHFYNNAGVYPVSLFGVSSAGCYSDTLTKNITIYSTVAFAGNDTIAVSNQPLRLQASGGINYEWSPPSGLSNAFVADPVAINSRDRIYILRAFTPIGCSSYDTISIKVYDGPEVYVPSAFTPNGDGLNELLRALPVGMKEFKYFTIYNRLGHIVFTTTVATRGWDGTFQGKAQNSGAYIWIASAIGPMGTPVFRKGTVMLVR